MHNNLVLSILGLLSLTSLTGCDDVGFEFGCPEGGSCTVSPAAKATCENEHGAGWTALCSGQTLVHPCPSGVDPTCWPCTVCQAPRCVPPLCEEVGSDAGAANAAAEALMACAPDGGT